MKEIILYGAGKKGKKTYDLLLENKIKAIGFCDSDETKQNPKGEIPIFSIDEIAKNKNKYTVIITIGNNTERKKVEKLLNQMEIEVDSVENLLYGSGSDNVIKNRQLIADYHEMEMEDYYENAEQQKNVDKFWGEESIFYKMFSELNLECVVELACGHGRHIPHYANHTKKLVLVDILDKNIEFCKKRFESEPNIFYYVNNGYNLEKLDSDSFTAVFSYDAMVHFEMMDIYSYLKEINRILCRGGRALLHHSNNTEDYRITFSTATSGRNYMSAEIFAYLANRVGFRILQQKEIDFGGVGRLLDCLTLLEKA